MNVSACIGRIFGFLPFDMYDSVENFFYRGPNSNSEVF